MRDEHMALLAEWNMKYKIVFILVLENYQNVSHVVERNAYVMVVKTIGSFVNITFTHFVSSTMLFRI